VRDRISDRALVDMWNFFRICDADILACVEIIFIYVHKYRLGNVAKVWV
jgi:hypothetical protein